MGCEDGSEFEPVDIEGLSVASGAGTTRPSLVRLKRCAPPRTGRDLHHGNEVVDDAPVPLR